MSDITRVLGRHSPAQGDPRSGRAHRRATIRRLPPLLICGAVLALVLAIILGRTPPAHGATVAKAWGLNLNGQLGDGLPAAGEQHQTEGPESCLFGAPETEVLVGCSRVPVETAEMRGVTAIAAGEEHAVALREGGIVWTWGSNEAGQLGDGISSQEQTERSTPVEVSNQANKSSELGSGVTAIAAGYEHSAAIWLVGSVWTWGSNETDQLGDGNTEITQPESDKPVGVPELLGATSLAAGGFHTLALKSEGTIVAWGANEFGQLGGSGSKPKDRPVVVKRAGGVTLTGAVALAAGEAHSLALLNNGAVAAWGDNESGQIGNGRESTRQRTALTIPGLTEVRAIAAGDEFSLALHSNGTVMAWGNNEYGQLGIGTTQNSTSPVQIPGLSHIVAIAAGGDHSLALAENGTVFAWGEDQYGQLGTGSSTTPECGPPAETAACSDVPIEVSGLAEVQSIAAGFQDSFAIQRQAAMGLVYVSTRQDSTSVSSHDAASSACLRARRSMRDARWRGAADRIKRQREQRRCARASRA